MFCWNKHKAGDPEKYKINGEWMKMQPPVKNLLLQNREKFKSFCNGVGSRVGFLNKLIYHAIPDSIGILNITGPSDLHDVGFSVPVRFKTLEDTYKYFEQTNWDFLSNLRCEIEAGTHFKIIRIIRYWIAEKYYYAVQSSIGWRSFMEGKIIGGGKLKDEEVDNFYKYKNA